jgi:hypothetical protein
MSNKETEGMPVTGAGAAGKDIPMIILRIAGGIKSHFTMRLSEWLMIYPAIGMWIALQVQPDMFQVSPSFNVLASWASEMEWAYLVLACGVTRLLALTINGTFEAFPYSPHMRLIASLVGIAFWSQFALGFVVAAFLGVAALSAVIAYTTFCLAELANLYRSWTDIGATWSKHERQRP